MPAYLVQYGRMAFVGRFTAAGPVAAGRGDRIVVRTPRGVETGTVLCEPADRYAGLVDGAAGGDLLRVATAADETEAAARDAQGLALLTLAEQLADAAGLPLTFLDAEVLLDGAAAILHTLPLGPCDADPLFAAVSARTGMAVRMLDVSVPTAVADAPQAAGGCGKPGCGSDDGGGCSSCGSGGGCSRKAVKTADELTAYFAGLRASMDAHATGRTPLH